MRGWCALVLAVLPMLSQAREAAAILHIDHNDAGALESALVDLAQQRLESAGLVLDREHVWLNISGALPSTAEIEALPMWSSAVGIPVLPLTFELRPGVAAAAVPPARATLAVRLLRPVWIAKRRLRKGSRVGCGDFSTELRDIRKVQRGSLLTGCEFEPEVSAQRDIAPGDALRASDIGRAPDVVLGAPVRVSASSGSINVTTTAIALADARVGDQIDVRLQHPTRTLRTRVIGRGAVQIADEAP